MHLLALTVALTGCTQPLEDQNAKLTQRVADLERATKRLEEENARLTAENERLNAARLAAERARKFEKYGYDETKKLVASIDTSKGTIRCTLRPDQAPETVLNFIELSRGEREWTDPANGEKTTRPLYSGTIFHRVIPEFMIQGGDPKGNGTGGPGYQFADEVGSFTTFDRPGLLAMANSGPDTNGSQFFVTEGTPEHLNGKHTIFGDCEDLATVKAIARVERDRRDKPLKDVVIKQITITTEAR